MKFIATFRGKATGRYMDRVVKADDYESAKVKVNNSVSVRNGDGMWELTRLVKIGR